MDERPKQRIWDGEGYESDPEEEEKILHRSGETYALKFENSETRFSFLFEVVSLHGSCTFSKIHICNHLRHQVSF